MEKLRDLLLFFAFSALPIASFLLVGFTDAVFYAILLIIGLVVLVWYRLYYKEPDQLVDYDENLTLTSLAMAFGGSLGIVAVASIIIGLLSHEFSFLDFPSVFHVPSKLMDIDFGQLKLAGFPNDALFQLVLVAPSEEVTKLIVHLGFYIWLKSHFSKSIAKYAAVLAPIMFWALLHTYRNPTYMGSDMWVMVAAAFAGGILIFLVLKYTKSLLAAILMHAGYNVIILYAVYYGLQLMAGG